MFLSREQYGRLLLGKSVNVLGINIRCFTIKEVIDNIGIEKYDSTLSLLNVDKLELMMFLKQDLDAYSLIQLHMLIPGLDETLADLIQIFLDPKEVVWNKESFEIKAVSKDGSSILLNQKNYRNFFRSTTYHLTKQKRMLCSAQNLQNTIGDGINMHYEKADVEMLHIIVALIYLA